MTEAQEWQRTLRLDMTCTAAETPRDSKHKTFGERQQMGKNPLRSTTSLRNVQLWERVHTSRYFWLASLVVVVFVLNGCAPGIGKQPREKLRMMVPSDVDCGCKSADIYGPLQASVERFERRTGISVEVVRLPSSLYESEIRLTSRASGAPDVIWTTASVLAPMVREGSLVPLPRWTKGRAMPFQQFPAWIQKQFVVDGELFGVPLAAEGDLRLHAYSVTSAALERGHADDAFDLIAHLSEEVPLRGLPDVALYSLELWDGDHRGSAITAHIRLKNLGEVPAGRFDVVLRVDGEQVSARSVDGLDNGATKDLEIALEPKPRPGHLVTAMIDPRHLLEESNEANNWATGKYTGALTGPPPAPKAVGAPFCIDKAATRTNSWDMGPKVGFDGQNYLVVWARQQTLDGTTFNHELRAARVTPSGKVLDPKGIVIAPGPKTYSSFNLAFSGKDYFVVWEVGTTPGSDPASVIEGRLISLSTSGQLVLGSPVVIDNAPSPSADGYPRVAHEGPDVAFTGSEFLVVYKTDENSGAPYVSQWQKAKLGIYARRVSSLGVPQGSKTQLVAYDNTLGPVLRPPRVEFAQGKGLVVFTAFSQAGDAYGAYGMWVTLPGGVPQAASPMLIDSVARSVVTSKTAVRGVENPRLAVGWPTYLPVWESNAAKPANYYDPDLFGTIVPSGGSAQKPVALVQGDSEAWPGVAFDGQNFALLYQHKVGCKTHLGAVRVNDKGVPGPTATYTSSTFVSGIDVASGASNGLAVFWRFNPPSTNNGPDYSDAVCAQIIDKSP